MDKSLYIHIGIGKAASSTLQQEFFNYLPRFNYLGSGHKGINKDDEIRNIIHTIIGCEQSEYIQNYERIYQLIRKKMYSRHEKRLIISDESFATGLSSFPGQVEKAEIAYRLANLFPSSKILIVIRNQLETLKSLFVQQLKGANCIKNWQEWLDRQKQYAHLTSQLSWLKYDTIYETYNKFFSQDNIHVLLFEDFAEGNLCFYAGMEAFLDFMVDIETIQYMLSNKHKNKRMTTLSYQFKQGKNNIILNKLANIIPSKLKEQMKQSAVLLGRPINPKIREEDIDYIYNFYNESNYKMSNLIGYDLKQKGYPIL